MMGEIRPSAEAEKLAEAIVAIIDKYEASGAEVTRDGVQAMLAEVAEAINCFTLDSIIKTVTKEYVNKLLAEISK